MRARTDQRRLTALQRTLSENPHRKIALSLRISEVCTTKRAPRGDHACVTLRRGDCSHTCFTRRANGATHWSMRCAAARPDLDGPGGAISMDRVSLRNRELARIYRCGALPRMTAWPELSGVAPDLALLTQETKLRRIACGGCPNVRRKARRIRSLSAKPVSLAT